MLLLCTCPFCGKEQTVELTADEEKAYDLWRNRMLLIQDAFPDMDPKQRELIKTGICEECWEECFGGYGD